MVESTWDPDWWTAAHSSAWERVKHALRRDWEQTKGDLADNGVDLNQGASDTIRQALGTQPIPLDDLPNPGPRHDSVLASWASIQEAVRYGYGAGLHYEHRDWDDKLSEVLQDEWHRSNHPSTWDAVKDGVKHGWHNARGAL